MSFLRFNKTPKHQKFKYIPRFYDPAKEELENRLKMHEKDNPDLDQSELAKERIKSGLRYRSRTDESYRKKHTNRYNIRLISIMFILFVTTYMILKSDTILRFIERISQ